MSHDNTLTTAMHLALSEAITGPMDPWNHGAGTIAALKRCGFIARDPNSPLRAFYKATASGLAAMESR